MYYTNDNRTLTIEELETILTDHYGSGSYERESGCYVDGRFLSVENILSIVSRNV